MVRSFQHKSKRRRGQKLVVSGGFLPARHVRRTLKSVARPLRRSSQTLHAQNARSQSRPLGVALRGSCVCVQIHRSFQERLRDYYIVLNSYGRHGTAFAETDVNRADYGNHHRRPDRRPALRSAAVVMFNPYADRSDDVSRAMAQEILRRLDLKGDDVPAFLEDFIDRPPGGKSYLRPCHARISTPSHGIW